MKIFFLYLMVVLYTGAGMNHFLNTGMYMNMMPAWLPRRLTLVYVSGICEVLFALFLLPVVTRQISAWLLIALLIAVFPANMQMAVNYRRELDPNFWVALLRLPLQIPLIWWAWQYTK
jgi:uncharacterized membrane protein